MSDSDLIRIASALMDAFNAGDAAGFKLHITQNATYDEVGTQRRIEGADGWVRTWEQWKKTLPDVKGRITNVVVSGNTVVQEVVWEGTQTGALPLSDGTHPPSGRRMATRATQVLVFEGDKVKENRHYFDMLSLLQQIGAAPSQKTSAAAG